MMNPELNKASAAGTADASTDTYTGVESSTAAEQSDNPIVPDVQQICNQNPPFIMTDKNSIPQGKQDASIGIDISCKKCDEIIAGITVNTQDIEIHGELVSVALDSLDEDVLVLENMEALRDSIVTIINMARITKSIAMNTLKLGKCGLVSSLPLESVARILMRMNRYLCVAGENGAVSQLYVYVDKGDLSDKNNDVGLYIPAHDVVGGLMRRLVSGHKEVDEHTVVNLILRSAPVYIVGETDSKLAPLNNGVYNRVTQELMEHTPDRVMFNKSCVDFVKNAPCPQITEPDGTIWNVEDWMKDITEIVGAPFNVTDEMQEEYTESLWKVIGAPLRYGTNFKKFAMFLGDGNNGKGTIATVLESVTGTRSMMALHMQAIEEDFSLEGVSRWSLIYGDENNGKRPLKETIKIKSIVTHDIMNVNRKNRRKISARFYGFMVQNYNDLPKCDDTSNGMYRRILAFKFYKDYSLSEKSYIKDDYLKRKEVLEYIVWRVLEGMEDYDSLPETKVSANLKRDMKMHNNHVEQFWADVEHRFEWSVVPVQFVFDLYKCWFVQNMGARDEKFGKNTFRMELQKLIAVSDKWWYCANKTDVRLEQQEYSKSEPMILEYKIEDWYDMSHSRQKIVPGKPDGKYKGLLVSKKPNAIHTDRYVFLMAKAQG